MACVCFCVGGLVCASCGFGVVGKRGVCIVGDGGGLGIECACGIAACVVGGIVADKPGCGDGDQIHCDVGGIGNHDVTSKTIFRSGGNEVGALE